MTNLQIFLKELCLFYCFPKRLVLQPQGSQLAPVHGEENAANMKPELSNRRGQIKKIWNLIFFKLLIVGPDSLAISITAKACSKSGLKLNVCRSLCHLGRWSRRDRSPSARKATVNLTRKPFLGSFLHSDSREGYRGSLGCLKIKMLFEIFCKHFIKLFSRKMQECSNRLVEFNRF